jgi:ribokinase
LAETPVVWPPLILLGSLNLDLVAHTARFPAPGETVVGDSFSEYPGGKGLNQAVAASRAGAQVNMVGCVGADAAGERLRAVLRNETIEDRHLAIADDIPTGRAMIWVDTHGENSIVVTPGANHAVSLSAMVLRELHEAPTVLAQLEVPVAVVTELFQQTRHHGGLTILNPAPIAALSAEFLQLCDVVVPNEGELQALGGRHHLHACGVKVVIETRGPQGALCSIVTNDATSTELTWPVAAPHVTAIDTTGAGDVFCGFLAAALDADRRIGTDPLTRETLTRATEFAAAAAAVSVTRAGAVPSVPHRHEVVQLLNSQRDST